MKTNAQQIFGDDFVEEFGEYLDGYSMNSSLLEAVVRVKIDHYSEKYKEDLFKKPLEEIKKELKEIRKEFKEIGFIDEEELDELGLEEFISKQKAKYGLTEEKESFASKYAEQPSGSKVCDLEKRRNSREVSSGKSFN